MSCPGSRKSLVARRGRLFDFFFVFEYLDWRPDVGTTDLLKTAKFGTIPHERHIFDDSGSLVTLGIAHSRPHHCSKTRISSKPCNDALTYDQSIISIHIITRLRFRMNRNPYPVKSRLDDYLFVPCGHTGQLLWFPDFRTRSARSSVRRGSRASHEFRALLVCIYVLLCNSSPESVDRRAQGLGFIGADIRRRTNQC